MYTFDWFRQLYAVEKALAENYIDDLSDDVFEFWLSIRKWVYGFAVLGLLYVVSLIWKNIK